MKVSVIIPYKVFDAQTKKCFEHCFNQSEKDFEIIALPDMKTTEPENDKIKIVETGPVKPSRKRNLAIKKTQGEILAFIDDDAYPIKDWLRVALTYFKGDDIGGIGGPNLTPKDNSIGQKVSGHIFASPIASGAFALRYQARYKFRKGLPVKEMPSCNLLVRKEYALKIKRALNKVKIVNKSKKTIKWKENAEDFFDMAKRYYSDAKYFKKKGDVVTAFAALNYAHGWLDAGARIGLFDVGKDNKLFTVDGGG